MSLTDLAIRNAKPKDKPYKKSDGSGLFIQIQPNGSKWWRYAYRFGEKRKLLALGIYPETSLAEARERHAEAHKMVKSNIDPSEVKKEAKRKVIAETVNVFEAIAREWYEQNVHTWSPKHGSNVIKRLEYDIFPKLGSRPINDITAPELLGVLRLIEQRDALDLCRTVAQYCTRIFAYGIATGRCERNPSLDIRSVLKTPVTTHHAHLKAADLPAFLQKLEAYDGELQTKLGLKLLLLTFVRTGELRGALWSEIDWDKTEWRIPAQRMKMKDQHIVPLSSQAVVIFRELQQQNGKYPLVFPQQFKPSKCMSENAMLYALYRMGYRTRTTGHGFRATASTILNENGFAPDVIERQLAHTERNKVRAAYNHAQYLPERRKMMQWWGDYVDGIANRSNVISANFSRGV